MATIAFCMMPIPGPMNGALSLAKSLRERGHEVCFVGLHDCEELIAPHGFAFTPMYTEWFPKSYMRQVLRDPVRVSRKRQRRIRGRRDFFRFLMAGGYREFLEVMGRICPDLFIIDGSLSPVWALLAYKAGLRSVYLHTTMPLAADPDRPPSFTMLSPHNRAVRLRSWLSWQKFLLWRYYFIKTRALVGLRLDWIAHTRKLAQAWGYPVEKLITQTMTTPLLTLPEILLYPSQFEFPGRNVRGYHHVEAAVDWQRQDVDFPWERLDPKKKLVCCSLGTVIVDKRISQAVIESVRREKDWQLVMTIGEDVTPGAFDNVPSDAILVHRFPQLKLLKKAAVMITHGGINSIKECIFFRVPMVVIPMTFDQPGAAARVVFHGLGVAVARRTAGLSNAIHASVWTVLRDPAIGSRLARMSEVFHQAESEQRAAVLIETILGYCPSSREMARG
jgi:zeaxanthin glucosyltransferase